MATSVKLLIQLFCLVPRISANVVILEILDWVDCVSDQQRRGTDQALALHHSHIQVTVVTLWSHCGHFNNNIPLSHGHTSHILVK